MEIKKYQDRKQNLSNAFLVTKPAEIKGKTILLIDDVATTGSTIFECAKVLKTAGAGEVYAAVIARQATTNDKHTI
jgi:predicted amidophosphoribosyltransferase